MRKYFLSVFLMLSLYGETTVLVAEGSPCVLETKGGGRLESQGAVEITQENGKLQTILVSGPSKLYWKEDNKEHWLTVPGILSVDPVNRKIHMTTPDEEQILFSDSLGQVFANQADIDFQEDLKPVKIFLSGNVKIQNETSNQYALADEAILNLEQNTLTLESKTRPKVLFYDELNKIQASAPALFIRRDPKTGQDRISGTGHVQFVFAEEELIELKKRFSFEK